MTGNRPTISASRLLGQALLAAVLAAGIAGCGAISASVPKLPPLGAKAKQESLRKAVEADPFPTAAQVGL